jgi:hypothetical protein
VLRCLTACRPHLQKKKPQLKKSDIVFLDTEILSINNIIATLLPVKLTVDALENFGCGKLSVSEN